VTFLCQAHAVWEGVDQTPCGIATASKHLVMIPRGKPKLASFNSLLPVGGGFVDGGLVGI